MTTKLIWLVKNSQCSRFWLFSFFYLKRGIYLQNIAIKQSTLRYYNTFVCIHWHCYMFWSNLLHLIWFELVLQTFHFYINTLVITFWLIAIMQIEWNFTLILINNKPLHLEIIKIFFFSLFRLETWAQEILLR